MYADSAHISQRLGEQRNALFRPMIHAPTSSQVDNEKRTIVFRGFRIYGVRSIRDERDGYTLAGRARRRSRAIEGNRGLRDEGGPKMNDDRDDEMETSGRGPRISRTT